MKVIIVGGVAGGATAAARIRRLDEHAEITVFERSGYISYALSRKGRRGVVAFIHPVSSEC